MEFCAFAIFILLADKNILLADFTSLLAFLVFKINPFHS